MGRCEVFITGSSAQMLSREIATQMRGRGDESITTMSLLEWISRVPIPPFSVQRPPHVSQCHRRCLHRRWHSSSIIFGSTEYLPCLRCPHTGKMRGFCLFFNLHAKQNTEDIQPPNQQLVYPNDSRKRGYRYQHKLESNTAVQLDYIKTDDVNYRMMQHVKREHGFIGIDTQSIIDIQESATKAQ